MLIALVSSCSVLPGGSSRISLDLSGSWPTITYPHGWRVYYINSAGSSFSFPLVDLSNRPLTLSTPPGCMPGQPVRQCAPTVPAKLVDPKTGLAICTPRNSVTVCAPDLSRLARGQVAVTWEQVDGFLGAGGRPPPGKKLTIDGHPARLIIGGAAQLRCPPDADRGIIGRVYFQPPGTITQPKYSNFYDMDACLRGPHLARLQRQVLDMLRSLRKVV